MHDYQLKALAKKAARDKRSKAKVFVRNDLRDVMTRIRGRASEKGWPFDLTEEWVTAKLAVEVCEATGIRFEGSPQEPFGRTFDRKDSTKGYTMDNCWVVCWIYNRAKLDNTDADVLRMAEALVAKLKK